MSDKAKVSYTWKTMKSPYAEGDTVRVLVTPTSEELRAMRTRSKAASVPANKKTAK